MIIAILLLLTNNCKDKESRQKKLEQEQILSNNEAVRLAEIKAKQDQEDGLAKETAELDVKNKQKKAEKEELINQQDKFEADRLAALATEASKAKKDLEEKDSKETFASERRRDEVERLARQEKQIAKKQQTEEEREAKKKEQQAILIKQETEREERRAKEKTELEAKNAEKLRLESAARALRIEEERAKSPKKGTEAKNTVKQKEVDTPPKEQDELTVAITNNHLDQFITLLNNRANPNNNIKEITAAIQLSENNVQFLASLLDHSQFKLQLELPFVNTYIRDNINEDILPFINKLDLDHNNLGKNLYKAISKKIISITNDVDLMKADTQKNAFVLAILISSYLVNKDVKPLINKAVKGDFIELLRAIILTKKVVVDSDIQAYLEQAVNDGNINIVQELLQIDGIELNAILSSDRTSLSLAIFKDFYNIANLLMNHPNININAKTRTFGSPLNVAINKWLSLKNNPAKSTEGILNTIRSLLDKDGIEYDLEEIKKMTGDDPIIMNLFPANK